MKVLMISGPLVEEMQSQVDVEIIFNVSIEGRDPLEVLDGLSKTGSDWELVFENDPPELANAWGYADIICRISRAEQCGKTIIIDNVPVCGDEITDTLVAFIVAHSNHLPEVITDNIISLILA